MTNANAITEIISIGPLRNSDTFALEVNVVFPFSVLKVDVAIDIVVVDPVVVDPPFPPPPPPPPPPPVVDVVDALPPIMMLTVPVT